MAGLFTLKRKREEIRLLDPGAGLGVLTAAFCERLLHLGELYRLYIEAYENDSKLVPLLDKVLKKCALELKNRGYAVEYRIFEKDFVLHNSKFLRNGTLRLWDSELKPFDYVISNPPYYKLSIESAQSVVMKDLVSGQPNIYPFFMALSLSMLKDDGEMVFITPRSFCSGLYYRKFRRWFLNNADIRHIHLFESRKDIFNHNEVLQENVILKASPRKPRADRKPVTISISRNKLFDDTRKLEVSYGDLIHEINGDACVKIPTSELDLQVQNLLKKWPFTLHDLGMGISTGPVVGFRARAHLVAFMDKESTAPLLWMHNVQGMSVIWPVRKNGKHEAIKINQETTPLLLPVKNYVLLKRFSSKEQKRRLYAGVLLEREFGCKKVGIENHLNYIYRPGGTLSQEEAIGMAALLNTIIIDVFFRSLNGNTQVNASDIRALPLPSLEVIEKIGKTVAIRKPKLGEDFDRVVSQILGIKWFHKYSVVAIKNE